VKAIHLVRYGVPAGIALAGVITIVAGSSSVATAAGIALIGAAVLVYEIGILARLSVSSQHERDREQFAREEFSRTGRWSER
jgi:hypothetical protein